MITYTMTKDELYKEIAADTMWLDSLKGGIAIKYRKQLNPKTAKEGYALLGITHYVSPRKNKIMVAWVRVTAGKYVTLNSVHYFEYVTKLGTIQYINPCYLSGYSINQIVVYSGHALQRLRERAGFNLEEKVRYEINNECYCTHYSDKYIYKGEEHEMFNYADKGMFITIPHEWGIIATTFVNYELLGKDQCKTIHACIEKVKQYKEYKRDKLIDEASTLPRYMRKSVLI